MIIRLTRIIETKFSGIQILITANYYLRKVASRSHKLQLNRQWGNNKRHMWFDRNLAFYTIDSNDCSNYTERIAFSTFFLHENATTLELGFGDGYSAGNYLARNSTKFIAVDNDVDAFKSVKKNYSGISSVFVLDDYLVNFPIGTFTNVIWDAGIGYFDSEDRNKILANIKNCLSGEGILTGFTIQDGVNTHNTYRFLPNSKEELQQWLNPYFKYVTIIEKNLKPNQNAEKGFFFACTDDISQITERLLISWMGK